MVGKSVTTSWFENPDDALEAEFVTKIDVNDYECDICYEKELIDKIVK